MKLMNHFLPNHQFAEEHSLSIPAPASLVLDVLTRPEVVDDPVARGLIALREMPNRLAGRLGLASALRQRSAFGLADFTALGRDGDHELAFGLVGRFWRADYGLIATPDAAAFAAVDEPGIAKLVLNFTTEPDAGGTRLTTRTRVWCNDADSLSRFRLYWLLIRPASGLIRMRLLQRARDTAVALTKSS